MFRNLMVVVGLVGVFLLAAGTASAQTHGPDFLPNPERSFYNPDPDMQILRKDLRRERRQLVAANMVFSDSQGQKFWPLYDQYETELARIYGKKVTLIQQFAQNQDTRSYITGREAVEDSIMQLRLRYIPLFREVLSAKETALFFRIDLRLCQMVDLQLEPSPLSQPLIQP
jgi:hypothetical protein